MSERWFGPGRPVRMAMQLGVLCTASAAAFLIPVSASAQTQVHLREPGCERLPFDPDEVRRLLSLELSLDDAVLSPQGSWTLGYELEPCAPGATDFVVELIDDLGRAHRDRVSMAEVPLATVARAIALGLAESIRSVRFGTLEAERDAPSPPPLPPAAGEPQAELPQRGADAPTQRVLPTAAAEPPDANSNVSAGEERSVPESGSEHHTPSYRVGILGFARNVPDTGAILFGARAFLDLAIVDIPLTLRLDLEAATGPVSDFVLGSVGGGLTLGIWAEAAPDLRLRFGPRLWLGASSWFDTPNVSMVTDVAVQVGAELRVGADIRVVRGLDFIIETAVGTLIHGLELERASTRTGLVGAYWGVDVGLAFH